MRHLKGIVQYKGNRYNGWQIQPETATIQGILQDVIGTITNSQVTVLSASRTDAGVHALGQVISFRTSTHLSLDSFKRAINALLPEDIRIVELNETSDNFHPRYDAKMKSYIYIVHLGQPSPFVNDCVWKVQYEIDLNRIKKESKILIGRHDFAGFMGSDSGVKNTVRQVFFVNVGLYDELPFLSFTVKGDFIVFEIVADGFLRHMVRNIVGTLIDVGRDRLPEGIVKEILQNKDRTQAGITAPAKGLFLKKVYY